MWSKCSSVLSIFKGIDRIQWLWCEWGAGEVFPDSVAGDKSRLSDVRKF